MRGSTGRRSSNNGSGLGTEAGRPVFGGDLWTAPCADVEEAASAQALAA